MDRRTFIKAAAGVLGAGALATPAIAQRSATRVLRFVPQADLANFDPVWTPSVLVRNAAVLVWDTLYGVDENLQPQRQMVEAEEVSADGLTWTFRLRPDLKFHDGERVLAKDVVASINRRLSAASPGSIRHWLGRSGGLPPISFPLFQGKRAVVAAVWLASLSFMISLQVRVTDQPAASRPLLDCFGRRTLTLQLCHRVLLTQRRHIWRDHLRSSRSTSGMTMERSPGDAVDPPAANPAAQELAGAARIGLLGETSLR